MLRGETPLDRLDELRAKLAWCDGAVDRADGDRAVHIVDPIQVDGADPEHLCTNMRRGALRFRSDRR
jgi:hypothetical protein